MKLRPYQTQAILDIHAAWQAGAQNVGVQLPTGAGKTVIFSKILAEENGRSIAIAHRVELVSQISLTLARHGVRHNIIAQKSAIKNIIKLHLYELNKSFYDPQSSRTVAGVDTLIRLNLPWFSQIKLVVQDEGHHVLKSNKWGKCAELFPNARGLYPTATPTRADGMGLGRHADGILDTLVIGPSMRDLISAGYLTDYIIYAPTCVNLDLSKVSVSAGGDYSPPALRDAVHASQITGDVVTHYLKYAAGKLGVTFAVDIEAATEIAGEFKAQGVAAEVISSKTPDLLRSQIMTRFRNREIMQLVNVDLLGEGVDVPAIEVVSMARPTQSYALYAQQFGRALRPMDGKSRAIIIDHVENYLRHGLPDDIRRTWTLDRREKRARGTPLGLIPLRVCLNATCMRVYEKTYKSCPFCGYYIPPVSRSAPEFVDGDLTEIDPKILAMMRGEITRIDDAPRMPSGLDHIAQRAVINRHTARQQAQKELRDKIALWAGVHNAAGVEDSEIYRRFYFMFGTDIMTAQTLNEKDANNLREKIENERLLG